MNIVPVEDDDDILRRLPNIPGFIGEDKTITSAVFKLSRADQNGDKALSVNIEKLVTDLNDIYNANTHKLVVFKARIPRECDCDCIHSPVVTDYSHGSIVNYENKHRKYFVNNCQLLA